MLMQLQWQNPRRPVERLLVMEGEIISLEDTVLWKETCRDTMNDPVTMATRPDGWIAVVCTEQSVHFIRKAKPKP